MIIYSIDNNTVKIINVVESHLKVVKTEYLIEIIQIDEEQSIISCGKSYYLVKPGSIKFKRNKYMPNKNRGKIIKELTESEYLEYKKNKKEIKQPKRQELRERRKKEKESEEVKIRKEELKLIEYLKSKKQGGYLYDKNGNLLYYGEMKKDLPEGMGVAYEENGTIGYVGRFKGGKMVL